MRADIDDEELKQIAATYFGLSQSIRPSGIEIRRIAPEKCEDKLKIPWEEHIGAVTGIARVSAMDILHLAGLECSQENYNEALRLMKCVAHRDSAILIEINGEKHLLVNPRYRR